MRSPRKIRRIERQYVQGGRAVPINIVSMIDIFAILVLYLLVSIAAVELRPTDLNLQLPNSTAKERPPQAVQLMITTKDIVLNNQVVMTREAASSAASDFLPMLQDGLENAAQLRIMEGDTRGGLTRGDINILADKSIEYSLLKKVMTTCTKAKYARISLAVVERKRGQP